MTTMKKPAKKMQTGGSTKPTYKNLGLARSASNKEESRDTNTPATKKDSLDYKKGFEMGRKGYKPNPLRIKYEGKNQYEEKGRWEGQNTKKKTGGSIKKAQGGTSLGMKSVKAGFDKNSGVTRADIIVAGKEKAKVGAKIKKSVSKMKTCKGGC